MVPDADVVLEVINGITFLTPLWLKQPHVALLHHVQTEHYERELGTFGKVAGLFLERLPLKLLYPGSRFVTVSDASATDLEELGIPRSTITVTHNGVEAEAFGRGERSPEPTLLFLGRLKKYKRLELLLDVTEAIPGATLEVAGDGDQREALEHKIAARGLTERVRMHGHVDEATKVELLQSAWVNLTASSAEGWCLTVMEAAACGTPSVAMRIGGLPESIVEGETGLLADDGPGLVEATERWVGARELRERMGAAAFGRAQHYSWDRTAQETLDVLQAERATETRKQPLRDLLTGFSRSDTGRAAGLA